MGALLGYPLLGKHNDLVCVADRGKAVRNGEHGAALSQPLERLLHEPFRFIVERAGGLVQNQDGRIFEEHPCDRDALFLPAGETHTAFPDKGIVAVRRGADEVMRTGLP